MVNNFQKLKDKCKEKIKHRWAFRLGYKSFSLDDRRVLFRGASNISKPEMSYRYYKKYEKLSPIEKKHFNLGRLEAERNLEEDYYKVSRILNKK